MKENGKNKPEKIKLIGKIFFSSLYFQSNFNLLPKFRKVIILSFIVGSKEIGPFVKWA